MPFILFHCRVRWILRGITFVESRGARSPKLRNSASARMSLLRNASFPPRGERGLGGGDDQNKSRRHPPRTSLSSRSTSITRSRSRKMSPRVFSERNNIHFCRKTIVIDSLIIGAGIKCPVKNRVGKSTWSLAKWKRAPRLLNG